MPENWCTTHLKNIINLTSGTDLKPTEYNDKNGDIPYITGASNFVGGELIINRFTSFNKRNSSINDILITCKGTIGKICYNSIGDIHIARQIMAIKPFIKKEFIVLFLENEIYKIKKEARSIIPGIDRESILNRVIPLPSENEMGKIIEKTKHLLNNLSYLFVL